MMFQQLPQTSMSWKGWAVLGFFVVFGLIPSLLPGGEAFAEFVGWTAGAAAIVVLLWRWWNLGKPLSPEECAAVERLEAREREDKRRRRTPIYWHRWVIYGCYGLVFIVGCAKSSGWIGGASAAAWIAVAGAVFALLWTLVSWHAWVFYGCCGLIAVIGFAKSSGWIGAVAATCWIAGAAAVFALYKRNALRPSPTRAALSTRSSAAAHPVAGSQAAASPHRSDPVKVAELRQVLRIPLLYDEEKIDRLIDFERERNPRGSEEQWLQAAIERWRRDNR
jgi:hypothetical protein